MSAPGSPDADDLIGDLIAEVARTHGIAISRDDPVIAVVLLNQLILRRYLEEAVAPATAAIREATRGAVAEIEQFAQAQARWLEQVSLKDRAAFLEEQKALHEAWKADMEALIEGQNGALRDVVMHTVARLRGPTAAEAAHPTPTPPAIPHPPRCAANPSFRPWRWLAAGALFGLGATLTATLATWDWTHIVRQ